MIFFVCFMKWYDVIYNDVIENTEFEVFGSIKCH